MRRDTVYVTVNALSLFRAIVEWIQFFFFLQAVWKWKLSHRAWLAEWTMVEAFSRRGCTVNSVHTAVPTQGLNTMFQREHKPRYLCTHGVTRSGYWLKFASRHVFIYYLNDPDLYCTQVRLSKKVTNKKGEPESGFGRSFEASGS